jgi:hypothetical protein
VEGGLVEGGGVTAGVEVGFALTCVEVGVSVGVRFIPGVALGVGPGSHEGMERGELRHCSGTEVWHVGQEEEHAFTIKKRMSPSTSGLTSVTPVERSERRLERFAPVLYVWESDPGCIN